MDWKLKMMKPCSFGIAGIVKVITWFKIKIKDVKKKHLHSYKTAPIES